MEVNTVRVGCLLAALVLLTGAAACGSDDDSESAKAQDLSLSISPQGQLTGVKSLSGGAVKLQVRNGAKMPYDVQIVKVDGNQTGDQVLKQVIDTPDGAPTPSWAHGSGGVAAKPGQTGTSTQVLGPGTYYLVSSADTEGEGPKPTVTPLKVSGGKSTGDLPKASATVTAVEYGFRTSGLKTGANTVEFVNSGKEIHHLVAAPIASGKTLADVRKAVTSDNQSGPPPIDFQNTVSTPVLDGGAKQVIDLNFKPGRYALICFISDRAGGPPHVAKGMISEVNVP